MKPRSLRTWMALLPSMVLFACTVIAGIAFYRMWAAQNEALQNQLRTSAISTAAVLDGQFRQRIAILRAITAALPGEPSSALADLHERSRVLVASDVGLRDITLRDRMGRQIWAASVGYARDLAGPPLASDAQEINVPRPALSDVEAGETDGTSAASFQLPVSIGGARHVLVATLDVAELSKAIQPMGLGQSAVSALLDRRLKFVVRSIEQDKWLGRDPSPGWVQAVAASPHSGVARFATLEGIVSYSGWAVLPTFDWTYGIAVPAERWDATLWRNLAGFLAAIGLVAVLGALLTARLGRQVVRATDGLSEAAAQLASAEQPKLLVSPIVEFNAIGKDLAQSAILLNQQRLARETFEAAQAASLVREKAARQRSEQASREKDEFMASLGHELRNPVAAIVNAGAVLQRLPAADARMGALFEIVARQGRNLARMVDDLMDVGRLIGDKVQIEPVRVDLRTVAAHAVEMLRQAGQLAQHEVRLEGEAAFVHGDASRLEQAVTNLVSNAARYTPPGGHIVVSAVPGNDGRNAIVRVSDDGIGIRPEMLDTVFDLFVQGQGGNHQAGKGLGVGLAVVRRIAALHGGTARAYSEGAGRGARFELVIPLATDAALPCAASAVLPRMGRYEGLRVLVVDDNQDLRESMRQLLQLSGCEVVIAGDGPGGVAAGLSFAPLLALVDIGLPGFDGVEVAHRLRKAFAQHIHIVAVSGFDMGDSAPPGTFDATLVKPITEDALELHLRSAAELASGDPTPTP